MNSYFCRLRQIGGLLWVVVLAGCAAYGGHGLKPGEATLDDVLRTMGRPVVQWENPDGSRQLSYPRGPAGYHSFMVYVGPDGRLQRIENVMDMRSFAKIQAGQSQAEVVRILGPSVPAWTAYFPARRELVWEWRYCDDWSSGARFDVLFDGDTGKVRSTLTWREICGRGNCYCSR